MYRKQSFIPQRQTHWKKYAYLSNRENKIFYDCECGKRYVSFPAIYLHFQRKHNRKLSTQQEYPQCQIRKNQEQFVYYYFVQMKRSVFETKKIQKTKETKIQKIKYGALSQFFQQFIKQDKKQLKKLIKIEEAKEILADLQNFIKSKNNEQKQNQTYKTKILPKIPLYLNDFAIQKFQNYYLKNSEQYRMFCYVLFLLSKWMNLKGYTNLIVQMNGNQEITAF